MDEEAPVGGSGGGGKRGAICCWEGLLGLMALALLLLLPLLLPSAARGIAAPYMELDDGGGGRECIASAFGDDDSNTSLS